MLPGMVYMDIVRSPFAHAKIKKIDSTAGAQGARRAGRDHRRDAGQVQPALDADADVGHPDGAAHREGDVPGAGGGGRHRHRPLRRRRRRGRGRGRLRPAAGRGRIPSRRWSRARRCCAPTSRTRRTTTSSTGRRATARHGRRRSRTPTSWSSSTSTSRASTWPRSRPAAASPPSTRRKGKLTVYMTTQAPARHPHRLRAGGRPRRASRRRRSASSRPTSAAASAARCRSIPAT